MRALSSYPDRPDRCICSRFFPAGVGFTIFGRLAADILVSRGLTEFTPLRD